MAEAASCAHDNNPVARLSVSLAQGGVNGDAGAEEGSGGCRVQTVWDGSNIVCGRKDVLLESSWSVVSGNFLGVQVNM